ncbi:MAG: hypothetical protein H5T86_15125 [Armatimonadetes bacterium]|nr:hypothetical protein [Armatimonadota bacterium]
MGSRLGAHLAVSGAVAGVELNSRGPSITVHVRVELTDVGTGELLAAENGKGRAAGNPAEPVPTDVLIDEAIRLACESACQQLFKAPQVRTQLVEKVRPREWRLAAGQKAGLTKGRKCLILRAADTVLEPVGVLVIHEASPEACTGIVLSSAAEPRVGDIVVAP